MQDAAAETILLRKALVRARLKTEPFQEYVPTLGPQKYPELTNFDAFAYGCCVLALSGHQERLAPGWHGGDRLAIHGGGGIGESISSGCIHARESDLHWLLRRVPLGTQITIHP